MEKNIIYTHKPDKARLNINPNEVLRYMGCKEDVPNIRALADEYMPKVIEAIDAKGCFGYFDAECFDDSICIKDLFIKSRSLAKNLGGTKAVAVFCVTLGTEVDRIISKSFALSPAACVCADAIATAAIEEYAGLLSAEISAIAHKDGLYPRPRFSPGYGDFDIKFQKDILNLINAQRLCGMNLSRSYLMTPTKSVTAVIGYSESKLQCAESGCISCEKKDCQYRREGKNYENNRQTR